MCEGMVDELMSRYGDLAMVWFDGGAHGPEKGGPDVLGIFAKHKAMEARFPSPGLKVI